MCPRCPALETPIWCPVPQVPTYPYGIRHGAHKGIRTERHPMTHWPNPKLTETQNDLLTKASDELDAMETTTDPATRTAHATASTAYSTLALAIDLLYKHRHEA